MVVESPASTITASHHCSWHVVVSSTTENGPLEEVSRLVIQVRGSPRVDSTKNGIIMNKVILLFLLLLLQTQKRVDIPSLILKIRSSARHKQRCTLLAISKTIHLKPCL